MAPPNRPGRRPHSPLVAITYLARLINLFICHVLPSVFVGICALLFAPHYLHDSDHDSRHSADNDDPSVVAEMSERDDGQAQEHDREQNRNQNREQELGNENKESVLTEIESRTQPGHGDDDGMDAYETRREHPALESASGNSRDIQRNIVSEHTPKSASLRNDLDLSASIRHSHSSTGDQTIPQACFEKDHENHSMASREIATGRTSCSPEYVLSPLSDINVTEHAHRAEDESTLGFKSGIADEGDTSYRPGGPFSAPDEKRPNWKDENLVMLDLSQQQSTQFVSRVTLEASNKLRPSSPSLKQNKVEDVAGHVKNVADPPGDDDVAYANHRREPLIARDSSWNTKHVTNEASNTSECNAESKNILHNAKAESYFDQTGLDSRGSVNGHIDSVPSSDKLTERESGDTVRRAAVGPDPASSSMEMHIDMKDVERSEVVEDTNFMFRTEHEGRTSRGKPVGSKENEDYHVNDTRALETDCNLADSVGSNCESREGSGYTHEQGSEVQNCASNVDETNVMDKTAQQEVRRDQRNESISDIQDGQISTEPKLQARDERDGDRRENLAATKDDSSNENEFATGEAVSDVQELYGALGETRERSLENADIAVIGIENASRCSVSDVEKRAEVSGDNDRSPITVDNNPFEMGCSSSNLSSVSKPRSKPGRSPTGTKRVSFADDSLKVSEENIEARSEPSGSVDPPSRFEHFKSAALSSVSRADDSVLPPRVDPAIINSAVDAQSESAKEGGPSGDALVKDLSNELPVRCSDNSDRSLSDRPIFFTPASSGRIDRAGPKTSQILCPSDEIQGALQSPISNKSSQDYLTLSNENGRSEQSDDPNVAASHPRGVNNGRQNHVLESIHSVSAEQNDTDRKENTATSPDISGMSVLNVPLVGLAPQPASFSPVISDGTSKAEDSRGFEAARSDNIYGNREDNAGDNHAPKSCPADATSGAPDPKYLGDGAHARKSREDGNHFKQNSQLVARDFISSSEYSDTSPNEAAVVRREALEDDESASQALDAGEKNHISSRGPVYEKPVVVSDFGGSSLSHDEQSSKKLESDDDAVRESTHAVSHNSWYEVAQVSPQAAEAQSNIAQLKGFSSGMQENNTIPVSAGTVAKTASDSGCSEMHNVKLQQTAFTPDMNSQNAEKNLTEFSTVAYADDPVYHLVDTKKTKVVGYAPACKTYHSGEETVDLSFSASSVDTSFPQPPDDTAYSSNDDSKRFIDYEDVDEGESEMGRRAHSSSPLASMERDALISSAQLTQASVDGVAVNAPAPPSSPFPTSSVWLNQTPATEELGSDAALSTAAPRFDHGTSESIDHEARDQQIPPPRPPPPPPPPSMFAQKPSPSAPIVFVKDVEVSNLPNSQPASDESKIFHSATDEASSAVSRRPMKPSTASEQSRARVEANLLPENFREANVENTGLSTSPKPVSAVELASAAIKRHMAASVRTPSKNGYGSDDALPFDRVGKASILSSHTSDRTFGMNDERRKSSPEKVGHYMPVVAEQHVPSILPGTEGQTRDSRNDADDFDVDVDIDLPEDIAEDEAEEGAAGLTESASHAQKADTDIREESWKTGTKTYVESGGGDHKDAEVLVESGSVAKRIDSRGNFVKVNSESTGNLQVPDDAVENAIRPSVVERVDKLQHGLLAPDSAESPKSGNPLDTSFEANLSSLPSSQDDAFEDQGGPGEAHVPRGSRFRRRQSGQSSSIGYDIDEENDGSPPSLEAAGAAGSDTSIPEKLHVLNQNEHKSLTPQNHAQRVQPVPLDAAPTSNSAGIDASRYPSAWSVGGSPSQSVSHSPSDTGSNRGGSSGNMPNAYRSQQSVGQVHHQPQVSEKPSARRLMFSRAAPSKEVADVKDSLKKIWKRSKNAVHTPPARSSHPTSRVPGGRPATASPPSPAYPQPTRQFSRQNPPHGAPPAVSRIPVTSESVVKPQALAPSAIERNNSIEQSDTGTSLSDQEGDQFSRHVVSGSSSVHVFDRENVAYPVHSVSAPIDLISSQTPNPPVTGEVANSDPHASQGQESLMQSEPNAVAVAPSITQFVSKLPAGRSLALVGRLLTQTGCTVAVKRNNHKMKVEAPYGSGSQTLHASISIEPLPPPAGSGSEEHTMVTVMRSKDDQRRTPDEEFVSFFHLLRQRFMDAVAG